MNEEVPRDDSAEGGALDEPGEGGRIPGEMQDDPVESGALEDEPDEAGEPPDSEGRAEATPPAAQNGSDR